MTDKSVVKFFIVGNPKSGTTFLYNYLKSSPHIFLPHIKEVVFFAKDFHKESDAFHGNQKFFPIRKLDDYHRFYRDAREDQICGDATPANLFSVEAAVNIFQYNPHAKIIISLREPVSYLRSAHFQSYFSLQESEKDFMKALALEGDRKLGRHLSPHMNLPKLRFYSDRIDYATHIRRYTDIFPTENVKIVLFDEILAHEEKVIKEIAKFIGVVEDPARIAQTHYKNPSKSLRYSQLLQKINLHKIWNYGQKMIPSFIYPKIVKIAYKLFTEQKEKPPLANSDLEKLKKEYFPRVKETNDLLMKLGLIEIDLISLWGYDEIQG